MSDKPQDTQQYNPFTDPANALYEGDGSQAKPSNDELAAKTVVGMGFAPITTSVGAALADILERYRIPSAKENELRRYVINFCIGSAEYARNVQPDENIRRQLDEKHISAQDLIAAREQTQLALANEREKQTLACTHNPSLEDLAAAHERSKLPFKWQ